MTAMTKPKLRRARPCRRERRPARSAGNAAAPPALRPRTTAREERRGATKTALVARDFRFAYGPAQTVLKGITSRSPQAR